MRNFTRSILATTLLLAHQGCGSDDGGGTSSTSVNSGLPPQTPVAELTAAQAEDLCNAVTTATQRAMTERQLCTFFAVAENLAVSEDGSTQLDQAACEASANQCVSSGAAPTPSSDECATAGQDVVDCDVTVEEAEACFEAQLSTFRTIVTSVSCSRTPTAEQVSGFDPDATPAACEGLDTRCPALFGSGDSGTVTPSPTGCDDTCSDAADGFCDDGGEGSDTSICGLGTDCTDCGERPPPQ